MAKKWLPKSVRKNLEVQEEFREKPKKEKVERKINPHIVRRTKQGLPIYDNRICVVCSATFEGTGNSKYCSRTCKNELQRTKYALNNTTQYTHELDMSEPVENWEWRRKEIGD